MAPTQKVKKQISSIKVAFVLLLMLLLIHVVSASSTTSAFATTPPIIDGAVTGNEWDGAASISLGHGLMLVKNDNSYLYLLVDLTGDTTNDAPPGDYFWLTFDVNIDKAITPNVDLNYGYTGTYNLCKQYYLGPGSWTGCGSTISQLGVGFGSSMNSATPHRIWEFAINRQEIQAQNLVRIGLRTSSQTPSFTDNMPENFWTDFSNLMEITLALQPTPAPTLTPTPTPTLISTPTPASTTPAPTTPTPTLTTTSISTPTPTPAPTTPAPTTPAPTTPAPTTPAPTTPAPITTTPTPIITPLSPTPIPFDVAKYVEEELNKLPPGRILFNPPQEMTVGESERVEVRLTKKSTENLSTENLSKGTKGRGEPQIENVTHVGSFMKVHLTGDNFDIETLSNEEQVVTDDFTQWEFDITPEKSGNQVLKLLVTVRILIPNDGEEKKDYPVFEKQIDVKVNPVYSTKNFILFNWQWILTTFIGLSGVIIGWIMKKKRKSGKKKYLQKKFNNGEAFNGR